MIQRKIEVFIHGKLIANTPLPRNKIKILWVLFTTLTFTCLLYLKNWSQADCLSIVHFLSNHWQFMDFKEGLSNLVPGYFFLTFVLCISRINRELLAGSKHCWPPWLAKENSFSFRSPVTLENLSNLLKIRRWSHWNFYITIKIQRLKPICLSNKWMGLSKSLMTSSLHYCLKVGLLIDALDHCVLTFPFCEF